jgi:hypothetical protein
VVYETIRNRMAIPWKKISSRLVTGIGIDHLYDRLMFLRAVRAIKYDDKKLKYILDDVEMVLAKARLAMKDRKWIRLCEKLRGDPKVYEAYFKPRVEKDW